MFVEIFEKTVLLQEFFGEHIFGCGLWLLQSPDRTPSDFFCGNHLEKEII
jgi:hypothetical protein